MVNISLLRGRLKTFRPIRLLLRLFGHHQIVNTSPTRTNTTCLVRRPLGVPPFLRITIPHPILFFLLSRQRVNESNSRREKGPHIGNGTLIRIFNRLTNMNIWRVVSLLVMRKIRPKFLLFHCNNNLIRRYPMFHHYTPFLMIKGTIRFFYPINNSFVSEMVISNVRLLRTSNRTNPGSCHSS